MDEGKNASDRDDMRRYAVEVLSSCFHSGLTVVEALGLAIGPSGTDRLMAPDIGYPRLRLLSSEAHWIAYEDGLGNSGLAVQTNSLSGDLVDELLAEDLEWPQIG